MLPETTPNDALWLHVDMNSYFASMIQQVHPELRGQPVGVLKGARRTCVIAASKEAKALGVKTGCSVDEARALAPNIVFAPAEFALYEESTRRLYALFQSLVPTVQVFSLDEAFLYRGDCSLLFPDPVAFGRTIQQQVSDVLGEWVTCTVGIARTRFLAKMAGECSPPNSVTWIRASEELAYLAHAPFSDVCGVGYRLEKKLTLLGIDRLAGLHCIDDDALRSVVGPFWAQELRTMASGNEPSFLQRLDLGIQPAKSVSRSITGYQLCDKEADIARVLRNLIEEVAFKARRLRRAGRAVGISLSGSGRWSPPAHHTPWRQGIHQPAPSRKTTPQFWSQHRTLKAPIWRADELFHILYHDLYQSWHREFPIIRFAVWLGQLQDWSSPPTSLIPQWQKNEQLAQAAHRVREKYDLFTVRPARLLGNTLIRPEVTGYLGDKDYVLNTS